MLPNYLCLREPSHTNSEDISSSNIIEHIAPDTVQLAPVINTLSSRPADPLPIHHIKAGV